ncbi:acyl carrier protein [Legionella lytica]|uniref:Acyl carrier protein n=1 Tax=Legionella lytica TaxID=96232 RepID=A0ABW8DAX9_9GAMM
MMSEQTVCNLEQFCCKFISKELGAKQVDVQQNFDSLGLSSIQALSILSDLESALDISLPETLFWDCTNVRELTLYLSENYEQLEQKMKV